MKASKHNGTAIAYGLVIIAMLSILVTGIGQFVVSYLKYTSSVVAREQSFYIAESGIYFYRWYLSHKIDGKSPSEITDFWNSEAIGVGGTYTKNYLDVSGDKIGESSIEIIFPFVGNTNVVEITSTGRTDKMPNITRTVKATLRRTVWSDFAVLSDAPICMDPYWTINGKVMANKGVHFDGVANNMVLSGVSHYNDSNPIHNDGPFLNKTGVWTSQSIPGNVFKAGTKYPVPQKDFNSVTSNLQTMRGVARGSAEVTNACNGEGAGNTGCYFDNSGEGRHIILKNDGTFDVCIVKSYVTSSGDNYHLPHQYSKVSGGGVCNSCSGECLSSYQLPDEGVIFVDDNVWLEGTINSKRITIAAASISDPSVNANVYLGVGSYNIKYTNKDGKDALGIISEGDIEILKGSPNNMEIDAALLTQYGKLMKPSYNTECCGTGCLENKNYLNIYGCVVTKNGLDFSYHKTTCPNLDISRTITYDNNLYLYPPPYFPADSFYYVDFWEEV